MKQENNVNIETNSEDTIEEVGPNGGPLNPLAGIASSECEDEFPPGHLLHFSREIALTDQPSFGNLDTAKKCYESDFTLARLRILRYTQCHENSEDLDSLELEITFD